MTSKHVGGNKDGIQKLRSAESDAQAKVKQAREKKTKRLKEARDEAQKEIEEFRQTRQQEFEEKNRQASGHGDSYNKQIEDRKSKEIGEIDVQVKRNKDQVVQLILEQVYNISPELHRNFNTL